MMTDNQLDKATAEHLAAVLAAIRPDWEPRGIVAALADARDRPLPQLVIASVLASANTDTRTPAVIALEGDHWRQADRALHPAADRHPSSVPYSEACVTCGRSEDWCRLAPREAGDDHEFLSRHSAAIQRARSEQRAQNRPMTTWDPATGSYLSDYRRREIETELAAGRAEFRRRQAELDAKKRRELAGTDTDPDQNRDETEPEPDHLRAETDRETEPEPTPADAESAPR